MFDKLYEPFYDIFWPAFCDVWKIGAHGGWWFIGTAAVLLVTAQLCWTIWRYIDDAEERDARTMGEYDVRRAVSGSLLDNEWWGCWQVKRHDATSFYAFVVIIVGIGGGFSIAAWPFLLTAGSIYGLLQAARGSRRLQKIVKRMLATLRKKADKDHNHDERYQKV